MQWGFCNFSFNSIISSISRPDILCVRVMRPEPVFCVLLGTNMAANVGRPQCTVGRPEVQMLGAIVS